MGLFDELEVDVASAKDPFEIPVGMHLCYVTGAEMKVSKNGSKGLALTYKIDGGDHNGTLISEWKNVPDKAALSTEEGKKSLGWLKQRLTSLGVPEDRMNSLEPEDLIGIHCYVTVKKNGEYTNVTKVQVAPDGATAEVVANPFL